MTVESGELVRNGTPFRAIGANYFTMFYRTLKDPDDRTYREGLSALSNAGIPFVRFMASGFWPVDWDLYLRDKEAYFHLLDEVIREAEEVGIGLIPSLFWHPPTVPDLVAEPLDQLGNRDSETIAFIRNYTREIVTRYLDSPAIWGWEFGNEYSLHVDLPDADQYRPAVYPELGTAHNRTERDELTSEDLLVAFGEFSRLVRTYDETRFITTGNSMPRRSAFHNTRNGTWKEDTRRQFRRVLIRDNPDPFDTLSVHLYHSEDDRYPARTRSIEELLKVVKKSADGREKVLFIGEFGASEKPGRSEQRTRIESMIRAIESSGAQLAALWVFDYPKQQGEWNVTFENESAYILDLISEANRRMLSPPEINPELDAPLSP